MCSYRLRVVLSLKSGCLELICVLRVKCILDLEDNIKRNVKYFMNDFLY